MARPVFCVVCFFGLSLVCIVYVVDLSFVMYFLAYADVNALYSLIVLMCR